MNPHQNTQVKTVQKLYICSHDRLNEQDDTSDFQVEFGTQVTDISEFCLRRAMVPLSSYTFNKDDDDRTFEASLLPTTTPKFVNNSGSTRYMNFINAVKKQNPAYPFGGFDEGEGIIVRKDSVFKQGTPETETNSIQLRIWNTWSEANGQSYIKTWPLGTNRYYTTIAADLYFFCQGTVYPEFYLRDLRIQTNWENFYLTNPQCQNQAGDKITWLNPDDDYDPGRDVFYFYNVGNNPQTTTSFNIGYYYWNPATNKYDTPMPRGSVENVIMSEINVKNPNGNKIYTFRPNSENCIYDKETISFLYGTFTTTTLITYLNANVPNARFGMTFSKTAVDAGDAAKGEKLVIATPPNTGYRRIESADSANKTLYRLGLQNAVGSSLYWDDTEPNANTVAIDLYLEYKAFSVPLNVGTTSWTQFLTDFQTAVNNKNSLASFNNVQMGLQYITPTSTSAFVPNTDYYAINMNSPDNNIYALGLEANSSTARNIYINSAVYNIISTLDTGLIPSIGYPFYPYSTSYTTPQNVVAWPVLANTTIYTVTFKTNVIYTMDTLLTDIQTMSTLIPALTFSIANDKLQVGNSAAVPYVLYNNERLGIYNPAGYVVIPPETSMIVSAELIDISSLNDVIYIGCNIYQDSTNSCNRYRNLTSSPNETRPVRNNLICSIWNNADIQFGKYISYTNDSDTWLRSNVKDLKGMHIYVYDSEFNIISLNSKAVHLEIDFR